MPTIVRLARCVIYIYRDDHNPPHFHIRTKEDDASVLIETLNVTEGSVDRQALKEALEWAENNGELLRDRWNEHNG